MWPRGHSGGRATCRKFLRQSSDRDASRSQGVRAVLTGECLEGVSTQPENIGNMKPGPNNPRRARSRNGKRFPPSRNTTFESNGPEVKIRGTAQQVLEKYLALAQDATSSGDRVNAEAYLQHAEHYYRMIHIEGEANGFNRHRDDRSMRTPESIGADEQAVGMSEGENDAMNGGDDDQEEGIGEAAGVEDSLEQQTSL